MVPALAQLAKFHAHFWTNGDLLASAKAHLWDEGGYWDLPKRSAFPGEIEKLAEVRSGRPAWSLG